MAKTNTVRLTPPAPAAEVEAAAMPPVPLSQRLLAAHRAAERTRDHQAAAVLNGIIAALGDAKHRARTALTAVEEMLDGSIVGTIGNLPDDVQAVLREVADL